ncbi:phosphatase PAP2/dual specificity phosphatase family protein [Massilia rubra]|uniref:Phosphatase PAP2/dual specificity phosphatase family protein n=1 Tax=Massilia rubra TaxID=2607910 RepID=A0ABX0LMR9_9BURK|nr:phosphatase PAP2/dual specificity phosphatase family protein [Massilia rubra]NHZ35645.1 phosphatase PAP2/dual specificity phosphatase family protein [Massilia rubra]
MEALATPLDSPAAAGRPWRRACAWLAFLGPFFFLTYGLANWWSASLPHVGSLAFEWERHIPFWDWTILPYMSIDAFYAVSLFMCVTKTELDTHAKRLLMATCVSVLFFFLFPLRFSFDRPETAGFNGALFTALAGFDKPFNQAPSLHISLLVVLWLVYARHLRGLARWLLHIWFFLIGVSVLTTFQHHAIDIVGGLLVAVACVYVFPDAPHGWRRAEAPSARGKPLALFYGLAGALLWAAAALLGGWAWLLTWPGTALLLVALAYSHFGVSVFQKHGGRTSWAARTLLLPYQMGAWTSSRWFTRAIAARAEVAPGVWIGRVPGREALAGMAVLDLTAEFHAAPHKRAHYESVPMLDLRAPSRAQLDAAIDALERLRAHGPVLVHCALGYSRSALVIAGWLLRRGLAADAAQALAMLRQARPQVVLNHAQLTLLETRAHG